MVLDFFFFFYIGLFLFSLEPFRVFLVIHLLTFFSDVPFLWICFHPLCWTLWGYFNLGIYILWLGSFFLYSLIFFPPVFLVPSISYLFFHFWTPCFLIHILLDLFYLSFYYIFISAMSSSFHREFCFVLIIIVYFCAISSLCVCVCICFKFTSLCICIICLFQLSFFCLSLHSC